MGGVYLATCDTENNDFWAISRNTAAGANERALLG